MRRYDDEVNKYRDEILKLIFGNVDDEVFEKILGILERDKCPIYLTQKVIEYHPRILLEYFKRNRDSRRIKNLEKKALKLLLPALRYIENTENILEQQNMVKKLLTYMAISEEGKEAKPNEWDA